jgi:hypothetical protein
LTRYTIESKSGRLINPQVQTNASFILPNQDANNGSMQMFSVHINPMTQITFMTESGSYRFNRGTTFKLNVYFKGNSSIDNTRVTINYPNGFSTISTSYGLSNQTPVLQIDVAIPDNITPGVYTLTGIATRGVIVPSFSFVVI